MKNIRLKMCFLVLLGLMLLPLTKAQALTCSGGGTLVYGFIKDITLPAPTGTSMGGITTADQHKGWNFQLNASGTCDDGRHPAATNYYSIPTLLSQYGGSTESTLSLGSWVLDGDLIKDDHITNWYVGATCCPKSSTCPTEDKLKKLELCIK